MSDTDEPVLAFHPGPFDVIMPGAFGTEPVEVPMKEAPGGNVIGTATVYPDGTASCEIDGEVIEGVAFVPGSIAEALVTRTDDRCPACAHGYSNGVGPCMTHWLAERGRS